jgi:hypothetical protein
MRTVFRRAAALLEALGSLFLEAPDPLVAGLAADPEAPAQLGHRVQARPVVADEPMAFVRR